MITESNPPPEPPDPNDKRTGEQRERDAKIVHAVTSKFLSKDKLPDEPDDLRKLEARLKDMVYKVNAQMQPIRDTLVMYPTSHPQSLHNTKGRHQYFIQLHKAFLDQFVHLSKDETTFLLAFVHATICMDEQA